MPIEREHRRDDRKIQDLLDKIESAAPEWQVPGKQTHAELLVWFNGRLGGAGAAAKFHAVPGRRTTHSAPTFGFHDFQALGLRDVLSRLGRKSTLRAATLAAADPAIAQRLAARDYESSGAVDRLAATMASTAAKPLGQLGSGGPNRQWQWRPFKTADGEFLIKMDAKNLAVLNRVVTEGGLTWKEIQQALGHKGLASAVARKFAAVVNKRLQLGKRADNAAPADAGLEDIGHLAYDRPSGKYVFRALAQSQKTQRARAEFAALTTIVRQPVDILGAGTVWIRATPIQHTLLKQLMQRSSWKRQEMSTYAADTWGNILGPINVMTQLLALRIALRFARSGPTTAAKIVYVGQIRFEGSEAIRFIPPITDLVPIKFGDVEYWRFRSLSA